MGNIKACELRCTTIMVFSRGTAKSMKEIKYRLIYNPINNVAGIAGTAFYENYY